MDEVLWMTLKFGPSLDATLHWNICIAVTLKLLVAGALLESKPRP